MHSNIFTKISNQHEPRQVLRASATASSVEATFAFCCAAFSSIMIEHRVVELLMKVGRFHRMDADCGKTGDGA